MNKVLKYSLKYRPQFLQNLRSKDEIVTTRLFDDHNLSVGDTLDLEISETGERFAVGKIVKIEVSTFEDVCKHSDDTGGNYAMYRNYYQRPIEPTDAVKEITIHLLEFHR
jgi:hypothetical protein